jgi:hypothetical protein
MTSECAWSRPPQCGPVQFPRVTSHPPLLAWPSPFPGYRTSRPRKHPRRKPFRGKAGNLIRLITCRSGGIFTNSSPSAEPRERTVKGTTRSYSVQAKRTQRSGSAGLREALSRNSDHCECACTHAHAAGVFTNRGPRVERSLGWSLLVHVKGSKLGSERGRKTIQMAPMYRCKYIAYN